MSDQATIEQLCVNTIRTLSMDAVQKANSGHPGTPMAMAPVTYQLWNHHLRFDPNDPIWPNRDRFVLSMGHASMLLYSMLHLCEVKAVNRAYETVGELSVKLDDIKAFRQLDSRCPGHPEYRWTSGVETTTGPLGQGYATSVGMAIAGKWLGAHFNRPGFEMFNHNVYALGGDGCMMEGAASEAASLAGHMKLDNLCWIYDNNKITIEGETHLAFSEDVATRFIAYGWNVTRVGDANDLAMLERAFNVFKQTPGRPTLIIVDSHIGWGAPTKQGTHSAHGEPLGADEIKGAKKNYGFPQDKDFYIPDGVVNHFKAGIGKRGGDERAAWFKQYDAYKAKFPKEADHLLRIQKRELPDGWDADLKPFPADAKGMASRESSGKVINMVAKNVPWLIGGSADLAPSTKTRLTFEGAGEFGSPTLSTPATVDSHGQKHGGEVFSWGGRNFHFGVRELGMGAILNGMSQTKVRPFGSGFFVFSDFSRPAIRLAAISEIPVIYVFTHDSIGVGEDGPTHQPIEHLAAIRAIPGLITLRPGDANEVIEAWRCIMQMKHEPVCLILSRQAMPTLDRTTYAPASGLCKGAYVLADAAAGTPDVILIGTGTEVQFVIGAYEQLAKEGVKVRAVSMPSWELFEHQSPEYKESVLPAGVKARVSVEQASTFGWERYVGEKGKAIGMKTFGASAPLKELQKKFGFSAEAVASAAKEVMARK
ncbi:MAG: transketolase [Phycisphaeraceae bacterium]